MSATSEILAERIRQLAKHIQEVTDKGEDASQLLLQYKELSKQLTQANEALTENRQILKGLHMEIQKVNLFAPMMSSQKGPPPLVMEVAVQPQDVMTVGGSMSSPVKVESYVLLSALPEEIRRRVETVVQAIVAGM